MTENMGLWVVQHACATENNIHFMNTLSNLFTDNTTRLIFLGKRINAQYLIKGQRADFFGGTKKLHSAFIR